MDLRHPARHKSDTPLHLVPPGGIEAGRGERRPPLPSFRRYPLWRVVGLDSLTVAHFALGCAAVLLAWHTRPLVAWPVALAYVVFAVVQTFVLTPLVVCPGCVYRAIAGARCPSALNLLSARLCPPVSDTAEFRHRTCGSLGQTSLSLCSWVLPVAATAAGLAVHLSWPAVALAAVLVASLALRVVLERTALCPRCLSRRWCPVAHVVRAA